jgi:hypothetical protein
MAFIGGSTQHGAKMSESSDTDWYGVFIPPKEKVIGIDRYETWVFPSNTEHRSRGVRDPFELDISLHSLQKWAGMAAKGNPTVLSFLFSKLEYPFDILSRSMPWRRVYDNAPLFISKESLWPFIHYGNDQLQRLMGLRGQKDVNRPILEQLYGYDTKYAMHIVRLMSEARELMQTGRITYPRPEVELLKDIRRGKFKLNDVVQMANDIQAEAIEAQKTAALPEKVDRAKVSELIADIHLEFYR